MSREEIIKRFREKGFNEETINLLLATIVDFEELSLTKYVSTDELVDRICKYLDENVQFKELKGNALGKYDKGSKSILISEKIKEDPEKLAEVFFHEFCHTITDDGKNNVRISQYI